MKFWHFLIYSPYGTGGYETDEPHQSKLALHQYFKQRLLNVDRQFARNIEYLFFVQHATDLKQIKADSNFALHLTKDKTLSGDRVNAGMLRSSESLSTLIQNKQAYTFLKKVRGPPAY